jgi:TPP-dependent pyruvate/acetoin dehydrogenase alpha subunit
MPAPSGRKSSRRYFLIPNEKLTAIHAAMVRCRAIEQRAELLFKRGKLKGDFHKSMGREASTVAFAIDLQLQDVLCLQEEDVMPALVKGASLEDSFRALAKTNDAPGNELAKRSADFVRLNILATSDAVAQIGIVRESAIATKRAKTDTIVLAFLSSASEARAKWDAVISFAGSKNLPVVFVAQGAWRVEKDSGPQDAVLNGVPSIVVDATDVVASYRVACEAIGRARQGRGPTLVQCVVFPDAAATAPVADRIHLQTEGRELSNPGLSMKDYLKRRGLWSEENHRQCVAAFDRELDRATRFLND